MSRLPQRFAVLMVAVIFVAACSSGSEGGDGDETGVRAPEEESEVTPEYGGTIIVGLEAETNSWLPGVAQPANGGAVVFNAIYDPLVVRAASGEVVPYLAETIEPNDDFTRYSVTLPEGVLFHDGTELTAEGIKTMFDEFLVAPGAVTASGLTGVTVEVTGPYTYDYVLETGDAVFLDNLLLTAGYPFSVEAVRSFGEDAGANPVGTGPFVFESWTRDGELRVTRNEDYWRTDAEGNQLPYLDAVVFRPIPDEDTRVDSLESGDIDMMQTLRQSTVRRARELVDAGGFVSNEWVGNVGTATIMNTLKPPFDDRRVRQALVHAVDQEQLIEVLGGTGITPPQTQWFSDDSPWWSEAVAEAWPGYDPDRAQELLDDYIDDPDRSDGLAPGTPIGFTFHCPPDPSLVELSQAYQAFWQQVGLEVDLNSLEQSALIDQALGANSDPPLSGDYEVQCWRAGSDNDPYTAWRRSFGPWEAEVLNFTNFTHPTITENVEKLRVESDIDVRKELVEEISLVLAEEVPSTWTGGTATAVAASEDIHGFLTPTTPGGEEIDGAANAVIRTVSIWRAA